MKIVLYPPVEEALMDPVRQAAPDAEVVMPDKDTVMAALSDAEVLFGSSSPEILRAAPGLKWIQSTSAGMDGRMIPEIVDTDIRISNASGVHAIQVAEHAWALTAALFRGLHTAFRNQLAHKWQRAPHSDLYGATVGIIGFGGIGRHYAKLAQGYELRILALDIQGGHKPDYVEALWDMDRLDDVLETSDVVFIACPNTGQTRHLVNARTLGKMKSTAFLVNTARGGIVDQAAITNALKAGVIAGAGLDVFEEEPLPADSPLWDMKNVIITPHLGGGSPNRNRRLIAFFCKNLERYLAGEPLYNEVDKTLGYPLLERMLI